MSTYNVFLGTYDMMYTMLKRSIFPLGFFWGFCFFFFWINVQSNMHIYSHEITTSLRIGKKLLDWYLEDVIAYIVRIKHELWEHGGFLLKYVFYTHTLVLVNFAIRFSEYNSKIESSWHVRASAIPWLFVVCWIFVSVW